MNQTDQERLQSLINPAPILQIEALLSLLKDKERNDEAVSLEKILAEEKVEKHRFD